VLEDAWNVFRDAIPKGWEVGRATRPDHLSAREWVAVGTSQLHVLEVMAPSCVTSHDNESQVGCALR
jgi:hypothetical protein